MNDIRFNSYSILILNSSRDSVWGTFDWNSINSFKIIADGQIYGIIYQVQSDSHKTLMIRQFSADFKLMFDLLVYSVFQKSTELYQLLFYQ